MNAKKLRDVNTTLLFKGVFGTSFLSLIAALAFIPGITLLGQGVVIGVGAAAGAALVLKG